MNAKNAMLRVLSHLPYNAKRQAFLLWAKVSSEGSVSDGGERWVVKSWDDLMHSHEYFHMLHAYRYYWAAPDLKDLEVIDLGCGTGYGTHHLSKFAKNVVGIDSSPKAIRWARKHFMAKNVSFKVDDALNLELQGVFDAVVCLELLEHIRKDRQQELMRTTTNLSDLMIMCIPNSNPDSLRVRELKMVGRYNKDKFHPGELRSKEFTQLLSKYYSTVNVYGQNIRNVHTLDDWVNVKRRPLTLDSFKMTDFNYASTNIFAVCKGVK